MQPVVVTEEDEEYVRTSEFARAVLEGYGSNE